MHMKKIRNWWVVPAGAVSSLLILSSLAHAYMWNGIEIIPRVSAGEAYDSNVTQRKNSPLSDMRTDILFGLRMIREGKTQNFSLDGDVTRHIFNKHRNFDNTAQTFNAHYSRELSKYSRMSFNNWFSHSQEPTTFADAFGNNNGRYERYNNAFNAGYMHNISEQLVGKAGYINDLTNNVRAGQPDTMMHGVNFGVDYSLSSADIVSGEYSFRDRNFDPGTSASVHELSGKYRHFLTRTLYVDLQTGLDLIDSYNNKNYLKPLYRARLTQDLNENTRASVLLEKQYTLPSSTQDIFNSWRFSANLDKQLNARLAGNLVAFYGEGKYVALGETNKFTGLETGLSYEFTKRTKVDLKYILSKESSSTAGVGYTRNVVFAGIRIEF